MLDDNPETRLSAVEARDSLANVVHSTPPAALLIEPVVSIRPELDLLELP